VELIFGDWPTLDKKKVKLMQKSQLVESLIILGYNL